LVYFKKRVLRLSGSPHAIALGFALGIFATFTPFIGLHIVMSVAVSILIGANVVSAVLATALGNPITYPFIWWSTYAVGERILGNADALHEFHEISERILTEPVGQILPILEPMLLGAIPLGGGAALVAYVLIRFAVRGYQNARRERLEARKRTRDDESGAMPA
jgi:uncharacterized protein (DUF2062 family)